MRVVAGVAKGRRLVSPRGARQRPTSDRVREAVFSSLESLGAVEDAAVLDLFAGTGALGVEALSRGAGSATFVDDDADAERVIRDNLARTGLPGTVVKADALTFLERDLAYDLAFVDPPYSFDGWSDLLSRLRAGVAVLESNRAVDPGDRFEVLKVKRYGDTVVTLARSSQRT